LFELDLSKNDLRSEGLSAVSEALKSTSIKQLNIAGNLVTYNQQRQKDMSGVIKFTEDMKDMGSLSSLTFCGFDEYSDREGDAATINTTMTEADFSGKKLGAAGAQILAAFMSTKLFEAKGSLSKLTFSGDSPQSKPVTVEVGMTEADFSGAILQQSGAMILAAWLKQKVQHMTRTDQCWFGLIAFSIRTRDRCPSWTFPETESAVSMSHLTGAHSRDMIPPDSQPSPSPSAT
jgi:hypothetical protein